MRYRRHHSFFLAIAITTPLCVAVLTGCGNNNGRRALEGIVTLDGKPFDGATISFRPVRGNPGGSSGASTNAGGQFSIPAEKGLSPGKYTVTIQKWKGTGRTYFDPMSKKPVEITAPIDFKEARELEATVADNGDNQFDFHLTSNK